MRERSRRLALDVPVGRRPGELGCGDHDLPVQGPRLVRRGRCRVLLRPGAAGRRARGPGRGQPVPGADRGVGQRQVVGRCGRACCRPSAAGVLPGSDRWRQVVVRPADHPMVELGRALRRAFPDAPFAAEPSPGDLDVALASLASGPAAPRRDRPVRGGLHGDPRRRGAERLPRAADREPTRPQGRGHDARRPLRRRGALPGAGAAAQRQPGARRAADELRAGRGHRGAGGTGRPARRARADPAAGRGCGRGARRAAAAVDVPARAVAGAPGRLAHARVRIGRAEG